MSQYPQVLRYYMWSWQVYFRIGCQTDAEGLFKSLDPKLQPSTFLVGFNVNPQSDRLPICIEPEKISIPIGEFENLQETAKGILNDHERAKMFYSGPGVQEEMDEWLRKDVFRLAIEKRLNESTYNTNGTKYFVGYPVRVEDHEVFIVLELNKLVYNSYVYLSKTKTKNDSIIYRSFLDGCIKEYLDEKRQKLQLPEPGKNLSDRSRTTNELRSAGARLFFYTVSAAGGNFYGLHHLFSVCNELSKQRYETAENYGQLIVAKAGHTDIDMTLELEVPFDISEFRKTRKMLELSNEEIGVVCDSYLVLGLGKVKTSYNVTKESIFNIRFKGIHCWNVYHAGINVLQIEYGLPQFSKDVINKDIFFQEARRWFTEISVDDLEHLFQLAVAATTQKKGAMLVITDKAKEEAVRFGKRCISIKPQKLHPSLLLSLTSIDGGVLIDPFGIAYAKGVILDGIVGVQGNAGRGSRYNSAVTYCEHRSAYQISMIVVVSADGTVDLVPDVPPQIKHSEIVSLIELLKELNSEEKFRRSVYYQTMKLLTNRRFYLTHAECDAINKLKQELSQLDEKHNSGSLRQIFDDFIPNPEMNESYYVNET